MHAVELGTPELPQVGTHHRFAMHPLCNQPDLARQAGLQAEAVEFGVPGVLPVNHARRVRLVVIRHHPQQEAVAVFPLRARIKAELVVVFLEGNEERILPPETTIRVDLR